MTLNWSNFAVSASRRNSGRPEICQSILVLVWGPSTSPSPIGRSIFEGLRRPPTQSELLALAGALIFSLQVQQSVLCWNFTSRRISSSAEAYFEQFYRQMILFIVVRGGGGGDDGK